MRSTKIENLALARMPADAERTIGAILFNSGKITGADVVRALRLQKKEGLRFGEACVKLGFVTTADIDQAVSEQFKYPYLPPGESGLSNELVVANNPVSPQVEALRDLRTQLLVRWFNLERKVLAICSPARSDGRSYLAANLALSFSQLGRNTLLIDGDMRQPRQHQIFNLDSREGLSTALAGRASGTCVQPVAHFPKLSVLPTGPVPPNPLDLLSRSEFPHLLDELKQRFDVVLIDTPAAALGADAQMIALHAGGALMLACEGQTRLKDLHILAAGIASGNAVIVGSVYNRLR